MKCPITHIMQLVSFYTPRKLHVTLDNKNKQNTYNKNAILHLISNNVVNKDFPIGDLDMTVFEK